MNQEFSFENIYEKYINISDAFDMSYEDDIDNIKYILLEMKNSVLNKIDSMDVLEKMIDKQIIYKMKNIGENFLRQKGERFCIRQFDLNDNGEISWFEIRSTSDEFENYCKHLFINYLHTVKEKLKREVIQFKRNVKNIIFGDSDFEEIKNRFNINRNTILYQIQYNNTNNLQPISTINMIQQQRARVMNMIPLRNERNSSGLVVDGISQRLWEEIEIEGINAHRRQVGGREVNNERQAQISKEPMSVFYPEFTFFTFEIPYGIKGKEDIFFEKKDNRFFCKNGQDLPIDVEPFAKILLKDVDSIYTIEKELNNKKNSHQLKERLRKAKKKFTTDFNKFQTLDKMSFILISKTKKEIEENGQKKIIEVFDKELSEHIPNEDMVAIQNSLNNDTNKNYIKTIKKVFDENNTSIAKKAFESLECGKLLLLDREMEI